MKKFLTIIAMLLVVFGTVASAEETTFSTCKLADAKGKQVDARFTLSDEGKKVIIQVSDRDVAVISYDNIDKFSYEYTKKHRVTQGAIVMVASLGAGAIVMLTKSKSHWLYIDYREDNAAKSIVLRLDKKDYQKVFESIKAHTGKDVIYLNAADKSKEKTKKVDSNPEPSGN
ncbi:MAG: hypothetical protein KGN79_13965 [Acidobacteriota bacterium]|nr:hypothetical protein [Acidobacteriota bacterium]